MLRTSRRAVSAAAFAAVGLLAVNAADAQWGVAPSATYLHAPNQGAAYSYGVAPQYSLYAPSYGYSTSYGYTTSTGYAAPAYLWPAGYASAYGYGYGDPYQDFKWRRGRTRHGIYTPYAGPEEIEYKFRRDGSVRIDVDD